MANTEWTVETVIPTGDDELTKWRCVVEKIADVLGLSLSHEEVVENNTTVNYYWYYSFPSTPGLGISIRYYDVRAHLGIAYLNGDTWVTYKSGDFKPASAFYIKYKDVGDYKYIKLVNGTNEITSFMTGPSAIDYFSGSRYDVLRTSAHGHLIYNDDTLTAEALTAVTVGGGTYPTNGRSMAVAAPVIYHSDSFYGFIGGSTSIYSLSIGTTDAGTQVQLAGHTFESIGDGTYWRLN